MDGRDEVDEYGLDVIVVERFVVRKGRVRNGFILPLEFSRGGIEVVTAIMRSMLYMMSFLECVCSTYYF